MKKQRRNITYCVADPFSTTIHGCDTSFIPTINRRNSMRPSSIFRLVIAALLLALPTLGFAQAWPSKPIKWLIPYTPAGITDNAAWMVIQTVAEQTGWSIVVENKLGANSILGADIAARSAPDGYTFLTVIGAHAANPTPQPGRPASAAAAGA